MSEYQPVSTDFPDKEILAISSVMPLVREWTLHFDGALNSEGIGIGATLLTPEGVVLPVAAQLLFSTSNNITEYEALILGLRMATHGSRSMGKKVKGNWGLTTCHPTSPQQIQDPLTKAVGILQFSQSFIEEV